MSSPAEIVRPAGPGSSVIGWKLLDAERNALLERLPPRFADVVADHVTLAARVAADTPLPPRPASAHIVACADDGQGVEALVVAIDGVSDRPRGGTYHITWSLAPGRRPKESNAMLAGHRWEPIEQPIAITLTPVRLR
jgi:hypothetical protein